MNLRELKDIALANVSSPSTEYFYRYACRWYSKTFFTPLAEVYDMPADEVFLAYFEEGYERLSASEDGQESMFVDMMKAIDPEYDEKEEESIQEFIEMIEAEEEAKVAKKAGKSGGMQSLQSKPVAPQAEPVFKRYTEAVPQDADGEGLEGLDTLTEG